MSFLASSLAEGAMWPFVVLLVSVAFVILAISVLRLHAFLALILAALIAGMMSGSLPVDVAHPEKGQMLRAVELTIGEFGKTAGNIAIVIAMATLIGMSMMESGAADKVVRRFLGLFGEKRAGIALLVSTYFLSIPIFFDTMFMLMVPIAMVLALRTGTNFTLYVLAICAAGVMTHSMTIPHPGPMMAIDALKLETGPSLFSGILVGAIPVGLAWFAIRWIAARNVIPIRPTPNAPLAEIQKFGERPESELPSFLGAILPVITPIFLISLASFAEIVRHSVTIGDHWADFAAAGSGVEAGWFTQAYYAVEFLGNKHIALMLGAALSLLLLVRQRGLKLAEISRLMAPPLETAGVIILITAAGGAFGLMLRNAGVGGAIQAAVEGKEINLLLLAWAVAIVIRIAQGSATVAMQTTAVMLAPLAGTLQCHPMYLFLAIGFGAFGCSWMNDSGFWVVSRLSGFTEKETLRTWTLLLTIMSVLGLLTTLLLAAVYPGI